VKKPHIAGVAGRWAYFTVDEPGDAPFVLVELPTMPLPDTPDEGALVPVLPALMPGSIGP